jgi:hypothetical protein
MSPTISIPESGLFFPNNIARIFIVSMEDILGKNGLNTVLNLAGQSAYIGNYPPNNAERNFDFASFSSISGTVENVYGTNAARMMAARAGVAVFDQVVKDLGAPVEVQDPGYKDKPLAEKISTGLMFVRRMFSNTQNEPFKVLDNGNYLYPVYKCPICWGRTTKEPSCFLIGSILQASVRWTTGGVELPVTQIKAHSCGDPSCDYVIPVIPNA